MIKSEFLSTVSLSVFMIPSFEIVAARIFKQTLDSSLHPQHEENMEVQMQFSTKSAKLKAPFLQ